jgi:hypothetical protein
VKAGERGSRCKPEVEVDRQIRRVGGGRKSEDGSKVRLERRGSRCKPEVELQRQNSKGWPPARVGGRRESEAENATPTRVGRLRFEGVAGELAVDASRRPAAK